MEQLSSLFLRGIQKKKLADSTFSLNCRSKNINFSKFLSVVIFRHKWCFTKLPGFPSSIILIKLIFHKNPCGTQEVQFFSVPTYLISLVFQAKQLHVNNYSSPEHFTRECILSFLPFFSILQSI